MHRDRAAAFALSWLGVWSRYSWAWYMFQRLAGPPDGPLVLPRPAVYLYHTDYQKWRDGTLCYENIARW